MWCSFLTFRVSQVYLAVDERLASLKTDTFSKTREEKMEDIFAQKEVIVSSIENLKAGWRDGSAIKSTNCSSEGPEFKSQQPLGSLQPSIMISDALFWDV
jgi:hypothetical protein